MLLKECFENVHRIWCPGPPSPPIPKIPSSAPVMAHGARHDQPGPPIRTRRSPAETVRALRENQGLGQPIILPFEDVYNELRFAHEPDPPPSASLSPAHGVLRHAAADDGGAALANYRLHPRSLHRVGIPCRTGDRVR